MSNLLLGCMRAAGQFHCPGHCRIANLSRPYVIRAVRCQDRVYLTKLLDVAPLLRLLLSTTVQVKVYVPEDQVETFTDTSRLESPLAYVQQPVPESHVA